MEKRVAFIENGLISTIINADMDFASTLGGEILDVTGIPCGNGWPVVNGEVQHPDTLLSAEELQIRTETESREWRDKELKSTDWIVPLIDHPQHTIYLEYRQALRDWPDTENFPDIKPTLLPEENQEETPSL